MAMDPKITDVSDDEESISEYSPLELAAGEALENDPSAPKSGGMESGAIANTIGEQRDLEVEQRLQNMSTAQEAAEKIAEGLGLHGNVIDPLAAYIALQRELDCATGDSTAGTMFAVNKDRQLAELEEREKRARNAFIAILTDNDWPPALAELAADLGNKEEELNEQSAELSEIIARADQTLGELNEKIEDLDTEHDELQARLDALNEQIANETDPGQQWMLEGMKEDLEADIGQNRAIRDLYTQNTEGLTSQIQDARATLGEAVAGKDDLMAQLREAKDSNASAEDIQKIKDQMTDLDRQIAQSGETINGLSQKLEAAQQSVNYSFGVDISDKESEAMMCLSPAAQAQVKQERTALIVKFTALTKDGNISKEDLQELKQLQEDSYSNESYAYISDEDIQGMVALYANEDSGFTYEGLSGQEATQAIQSAWQELEAMKGAAKVELDQAKTEHDAAQAVETAEASETAEVVQDATTAITGMGEYASVWEFMSDKYAPTEAEGKESIISVMNDPDRYLRSDEGNLVYVSNADQRMYTLGEDENGEATQNFLSHEETAELNRQVVEDGMIPRNYAFDADREGVLDHITQTNVIDAVSALWTSASDAYDVANSEVNVPDEYSPFDTWQDTFDASGEKATIAARAQVLVDSVTTQVTEHAAAIEKTEETAQIMAKEAQEYADLEQAQLLAQQNPELSPDDALAQVQAERENAIVAEEGDASSKEDIWTENDQLDMEAPDPELVFAAGKIMNQVENKEITADNLADVLTQAKAELGLSNEQVDLLLTAIENDPDVNVQGDMEPHMDGIMAAPSALVSADVVDKLDDAATPIVMGIVVPQQTIVAATSTPDANGIEPSTEPYASFADHEFQTMSHDPDAEAYNWVQPESIVNSRGLAVNAMNNVLNQSSSSSSGAGTTDTGVQPDPSLMMTEEQRLAAQNATMGVNATGGAGGGGMAG